MQAANLAESMLVVEDLGSPADDRCANEGYTDVDQDGKPLNPPHSQSRMSRRTPSQILGGTPSTTNMITDFELDVTPKSHYGPRPNMPFRYAPELVSSSVNEHSALSSVNFAFLIPVCTAGVGSLTPA